MLLDLEIALGVGTGIEGIASPGIQYKQQAKKVMQDTEQVAQLLGTIRDQVASFAEVVPKIC